MKKTAYMLLLLTAVFILSAFAMAESRILVACFSATGNTAAIAQMAADALHADYYEILPETPYTAADIQYTNNSCRANREQNDPDCRPAIAGELPDLDSYDTVLIAFPIWWGEEPRIIDTFMESYDFSGKALAAFCTSGSSGIYTAERNLKAYVLDSTWHGARRFAAGADAETVNAWLEEINLYNSQEEMRMKIQVGEAVLNVRLADNDSARALTDLLAGGPLTISASNYGGFEKVCPLGTNLPSNDVQTTTQPGDVMLYAGNHIVIFHGRNDWAYTRLGWVEDIDAAELRSILSGNADTVTLFCD